MHTRALRGYSNGADLPKISGVIRLSECLWYVRGQPQAQRKFARHWHDPLLGTSASKKRRGRGINFCLLHKSNILIPDCVALPNVCIRMLISITSTLLRQTTVDVTIDAHPVARLDAAGRPTAPTADKIQKPSVATEENVRSVW